MNNIAHSVSTKTHLAQKIEGKSTLIAPSEKAVHDYMLALVNRGTTISVSDKACGKYDGDITITTGGDIYVNKGGQQTHVANIRGPVGRDGLRGLPGEIGLTGAPGQDGRDGLPGRDGMHGLPGADGKDGRDGADGRDGVDGKDGKDGARGPQGPVGPQGPKGDPGVGVLVYYTTGTLAPNETANVNHASDPAPLFRRQATFLLLPTYEVFQPYVELVTDDETYKSVLINHQVAVRYLDDVNTTFTNNTTKTLQYLAIVQVGA